MKVSSLDWTAFRLPFRGEFATSHSTFTSREGVILQLSTDAGFVGLGEASPLPQKDEGSVQNVLTILDKARAAVIGKQLDEIPALLSWPGQDRSALAAVRCAFDVAVCDVMAKATGSSIAQFLTPHVRRSVEVNATIGASSTVEACKAALKAQIAGFHCIKLKVGMARSIDEERDRVATVRTVLEPQVKLRLDANGAWEVEQAIRTIRALERYDLEFIEQPVRPGDWQGMRRVREAVRSPIAADEDVTDLDAARHILQPGAAQILVLKPMAVGGLRPARQIIDLAQAAHIAVVVTTTIDAGIGAAAALHLAATLPHDSLACGLATGDLLASDLLANPLAVNEGRMQLPTGSGLGVELDTAALQRYNSSEEEVS